jgi:uncharacterized protein
VADVDQQPTPEAGGHAVQVASGSSGVSGSTLGHLVAIGRYPVKSLVGEGHLESAVIDNRGIAGDRLWAVRDVDGKFGSGKSTRRFRRMPGLLALAARYANEQLPMVRFPDGCWLSGHDPGIHQALSAHVGRQVTLAPEAAVSHFDEGSLHLVTTSSLTRLSELHGSQVDLRRVRANLVLDDAQGPAFDEHDWIGQELRIGPEVRLRVRKPMIRCVMLDLPQFGLAADEQLFKTVTRVNDAEFGLVLDVLRPGTVRRGDPVTVG